MGERRAFSGRGPGGRGLSGRALSGIAPSGIAPSGRAPSGRALAGVANLIEVENPNAVKEQFIKASQMKAGTGQPAELTRREK